MERIKALTRKTRWRELKELNEKNHVKN